MLSLVGTKQSIVNYVFTPSPRIAVNFVSINADNQMYCCRVPEYSGSEPIFIYAFLKESYSFYKIIVTEIGPHNLNLIYLMKFPPEYSGLSQF
jgi:hypothetical protein